MKKPSRPLVLAALALVAALTVAAFDNVMPTPPTMLPPLSSADRAFVVDALRDLSLENINLWGAYYARTPNERAYWNGRAEGFEAAATYLATYRPRASATAADAQQTAP